MVSDFHLPNHPSHPAFLPHLEKHCQFRPATHLHCTSSASSQANSSFGFRPWSVQVPPRRITQPLLVDQGQPEPKPAHYEALYSWPSGSLGRWWYLHAALWWWLRAGIEQAPFLSRNQPQFKQDFFLTLRFSTYSCWFSWPTSRHALHIVPLYLTGCWDLSLSSYSFLFIDWWLFYGNRFRNVRKLFSLSISGFPNEYFFRLLGCFVEHLKMPKLWTSPAIRHIQPQSPFSF